MPRPLGCLFRLLALLLVGALAAVVLWPLLARPYLRDRARDELREGIATEIAVVEPPALPASGELVLTEAALNDELRARAGAFGPISDPRLRITRDELRLTFSLYGTGNAITGRPTVRAGRVHLRDAALDGPAAAILTAEDVTKLVDEQLTNLLRQAGVAPTGIELRDGALSLSTAESANSTMRP